MKHILDKVSYHAVYDESIVDALRYARGHGFAGVQVAVETPHLSFEGLGGTEREEIARLADEYGLSIGLHAPDELASLFVTSRHLSEGILAYFEALFDFAEHVAARLVTVHLGSMTRFRTDEDPPEAVPPVDRAAYLHALEANLRRLVDLARRRFTLCVEYWKADPAVEALLQPHLESGELSLCWDLAKTCNRRGQPASDPTAYFWDHLSHVRQVHLHDLRGGVSHFVVGTGEVDFMAFLPRLAEADVLDYVIEVRPRERALESLRNLRVMISGV